MSGFLYAKHIYYIEKPNLLDAQHPSKSGHKKNAGHQPHTGNKYNGLAPKLAGRADDWGVPGHYCTQLAGADMRGQDLSGRSPSDKRDMTYIDMPGLKLRADASPADTCPPYAVADHIKALMLSNPDHRRTDEQLADTLMDRAVPRVKSWWIWPPRSTPKTPRTGPCWYKPAYPPAWAL